MRQMSLPLHILLFSLVCSSFLGVLSDVGTAASYHPPYLPTRCGGYSEELFPEDGLFVSVSDGLWDNGAACGRQYQVCCISGPNRPCQKGYIIATVVDFCRISPCPATMVLSDRAFSAISKHPRARINIEYAQI